MASPATDAAIEAQRRLRALVARLIGQIWTGLPAYDRDNIDEWLSSAVPLVLTAQRSSVAITEGYLAQILERQPLGVNPDELIGSAVRNGVEPSEVYQRPFVTLWSALGEGVVYEDAVSKALARAQSSAAMDVQLSMRATANAIQEADPYVYGYERAADPGACTFCSLVDGAYVKSADAMPLHNNCGCGLEPLTAPRSRPASLPKGVAVHPHGELGPVLTDPAHDFTTAAQALS